MAAVSASSASEIAPEGPVLNLINKRLRALRKKLNRISQMEDSVAQGKILNKEQEDTLSSKASVLAGIDELEKIRQPLSHAVDQEIGLALEKSKQKKKTKAEDLTSTEMPNEGDAAEEKAGEDGDSGVADLLNLLYFGSVFDVKTLMRAHDTLLTRTHERNCCLTYDYVTDDDAAGDPLKEWDLDVIAMLGGSLISRPVNSSLSHKNALQKCVEHAKLWLANSEQPIGPDSNITYAGLREKLNKIMASDYFTTTPEIKAPVEVAAAGGNYASFQVNPPVSVTVPVEGSGLEYQKEEEQSPNSQDDETNGEESGHVEEHHQGGGSEVENTSESAQAQRDLDVQESEGDQNSKDADFKEQYPNRKPYQNYRGGSGGRGRGGYQNGRGGRGRGGYQNGRSQFYDQQGGGGYYQRNSYRGRGGRGMGANYNYHASAGHQAGHVEAAS